MRRVRFSLLALLAAATVASAAENYLLEGSNLGVWGTNADGTINDAFMSNAGIRTKASAVIGLMRFPCRSFTSNQLQSIASTIRNVGIEPLAILTAKNQTNALSQVKDRKSTRLNSSH